MTTNRIVFENPELLKIVRVKGEYVLNYGGEPVKIFGGSIISHKSEYLIQRIKDDVRPCLDDTTENIIYTYLKSESDIQRGGGNVRSGPPDKCFYFDGWPYHMYLMQQDGADGPLEDDWEGSIKSDRMLYMKESLREERQIQLIINWLHECKCELPNLWPKLGEKSANMIGREIEGGGRILPAIEYGEKNGETIPEPDTQFVATLEGIYLKLQPEERAFITACYFETGDVIYPIALALRKAKFSEYSFVCPGVECDLQEQYEYIHYAGDFMNKILNEIKGGESSKCEFKSTLRWNIKANKIDKTMTRDCLKAISGFLNTDGGILFIGVSDDGDILGLTQDSYKNGDEFLRSLVDSVDASLGKYSTTLIDPQIIKMEDKNICRVECIKGTKEIYMKWGNEMTLNVRSGPSTRSLLVSEIHDYVASHFGSKD